MFNFKSSESAHLGKIQWFKCILNKDVLPLCVSSLMFVFCFLVTGVLSKHIDHRNLFTQRVCCKRQSHFVYIGQGKAPHYAKRCSEQPINPPVNVGMCHYTHI